MKHWHSPLAKITQNPVAFLLQVITGFNANQGMLLSGAVAYYTLLSIIPFFILVFFGLSFFIDSAELTRFISSNLHTILPNQAQAIATHIAYFVSETHIGWYVLAILLFFSSMTFSVLENAMSVIFLHRVKIRRRHFIISAIIPYLYILVLGVGFLLITLISGALQMWQGETITLFAWQWHLDGLTSFLLYLVGIIGLILILMSVYMVMPVGNICWRHALIGSIGATILWEIARHILVWYFSTLSMVNMIYGSLATAIIFLLFLEAGAIILLLGAQFIAEYERLGFNVSKQTEGFTTE